MSDIDAYFGKSVRAFRSAANMSQRTFADALTAVGMPVDASAVSRIESGDRSVRLNEVQKIAAVLGCGIMDLIHDDSGSSQDRNRAVIDMAIAELAALRESV